MNSADSLVCVVRRSKLILYTLWKSIAQRYEMTARDINQVEVAQATASETRQAETGWAARQKGPPIPLTHQ